MQAKGKIMLIASVMEQWGCGDLGTWGSIRQFIALLFFIQLFEPEMISLGPRAEHLIILLLGPFPQTTINHSDGLLSVINDPNNVVEIVPLFLPSRVKMHWRQFTLTTTTITTNQSLLQASQVYVRVGPASHSHFQREILLNYYTMLYVSRCKYFLDLNGMVQRC